MKEKTVKTEKNKPEIKGKEWSEMMVERKRAKKLAGLITDKDIDKVKKGIKELTPDAIKYLRRVLKKPEDYPDKLCADASRLVLEWSLEEQKNQKPEDPLKEKTDVELIDLIKQLVISGAGKSRPEISTGNKT